MKHYTYTHSTPDGVVFYVGKGVDKRAFSATDRSYLWYQKREDAGGINIKIVNRFDTEEEAFLDEIRLIKHYKALGCDLVNRTDGGSSISEKAFSKEAIAKRSKKLTGYVHKKIQCPHCGESGGQTAIKRWHFDNCKGARPKFKVRPTVFGERLYIGKVFSKEVADAMSKEFVELCEVESVDIEKLRAGASASRWTIV
jgi:hypothetical protein